MIAGKGYNQVSADLEYPRVANRGWIGTRKGVWHDQLANSSLPSCRYAGIVLLIEKIVSNSLIILQDMRVKDFICIMRWPASDPELLCK